MARPLTAEPGTCQEVVPGQRRVSLAASPFARSDMMGDADFGQWRNDVPCANPSRWCHSPQRVRCRDSERAAGLDECETIDLREASHALS